MLIADLDVRVVHPITGEILRHLTLDPTRNYQPAEPPTHKHPTPRRFGLSGMS